MLRVDPSPQHCGAYKNPPTESQGILEMVRYAPPSSTLDPLPLSPFPGPSVNASTRARLPIPEL